MRTKEKEKITHFSIHVSGLRSETENVARIFPYYGRLINELYNKSKKLYDLYVKENGDTKVSTRIKNLKKTAAIGYVLKLKRGLVLHAIESGNKSLQSASEYTYSDFNRPSEEIRLVRFHEVLNGTKRIKHPEHYGISRETIKETEKLIRDYCESIAAPANRKKERARQAKQCRKMLAEINFILRKKMAPFMENIKEDYPSAAFAFRDFLNPKKTGRPANKPVRKQRTIKTEKENLAVKENNNAAPPFENNVLVKQEV